jgi:hypothetical protein
VEKADRMTARKLAFYCAWNREAGRATFDALLQSRPNVFAGTLLVSDATLCSSTAGGLESLQRLWRNVLERPKI